MDCERHSFIRALLVALCLASATTPLPADTLVLHDGSRIVVRSYQVQGRIVVFEDLKGQRFSLTVELVDLAATAWANPARGSATAKAEPRTLVRAPGPAAEAPRASHGPVLPASPPPSEAWSRAERAAERGDLAVAASEWLRLAEDRAGPAQGRERLRALVAAAESQMALGDYAAAGRTLELAQASLSVADPELRASVATALGTLYASTRPTEEAERQLDASIEQALGADAPSLAAVAWTNKGTLLLSQQRVAEAIAAYQSAVETAARSDSPAIKARALANLGRTARASGDLGLATRALVEARAVAERLSPSPEKAQLLTHIGRSYLGWVQDVSRAPGDARTQGRSALEAAAAVAEEIDDSLAVSYAYGYLGAFSESAGRGEEALNLTRRALFAATVANAPQSLYRWHWQMGRLLARQGQSDAAVASYRSAVKAMSGIRSAMAARRGGRAGSYLSEIEPVYRGLVELLLGQAETATDQQRQQLLRESRDAMEELKAEELRDYFEDECVAALEARTREVSSVSRSAMVIYPLLLSDRTELLIDLPEGLHRVSVDVGRSELEPVIDAFLEKLKIRNLHEYLGPARQLHEWLIAPLAPLLESHPSIDTLVFVPYGPLMTIPLGALHDGERFLIEKYAVVVTPGLRLTDPKPFPRGAPRMLVAGVSEPVLGFDALLQVPSEVDALRGLYPTSKVLLNGEFARESLRSSLRTGEYSVLHIASHAKFDRAVDDAYLVAYDGKLTIDELSDYVGILRFRETPLDLLTLSACETAAGDDRAALGLSGIALKAGARSALGSLWSVNDVAARHLIVRFYEEMTASPQISKAKALQRSQLSLLRSMQFEHPWHWAAFLLIGNWL